MALWKGKKTMSDEVSWGEFLHVVIITGEYSNACVETLLKGNNPLQDRKQ